MVHLCWLCILGRHLKIVCPYRILSIPHIAFVIGRYAIVLLALNSDQVLLHTMFRRGITGRPSAVPRGFRKTSLSHLQLCRSYGKGMLTVDSINPAALNVQYAVRGELAIKAEEYRVQLKTGDKHNLPFNRVISSNIGNPQQLGLDQPPITFVRQVGCL